MAPYTDKDFAAYEAKYKATRSGTPVSAPSAAPAKASKNKAVFDELMK
jgi:hypothetical protein